jgi:hypothetical protein
MNVKRRVQNLEGAERPSNKPEPSGVVIYNLKDGSGLVYETGLHKKFTEEQLSKVYAKAGVMLQIRLPDNGREPLEVEEWKKER